MKTRFTELAGIEYPIMMGGIKGCELLETGDMNAGLLWGGQIQGLIHDSPGARELVSRIMSEATAIIGERLAKFAA